MHPPPTAAEHTMVYWPVAMEKRQRNPTVGFRHRCTKPHAHIDYIAPPLLTWLDSPHTVFRVAGVDPTAWAMLGLQAMSSWRLVIPMDVTVKAV